MAVDVWKILPSLTSFVSNSTDGRLQVYAYPPTPHSVKKRQSVELIYGEEDIETGSTLNEMSEKVSVSLHCPTASWEVAVDDNVCIAPIMAKFVQISKYIINANTEDENEMNNAAPFPTSFKMKNTTKSMLSY
ncbi:hypothetical protein TNCV_947911 [Trichonephila clavipes]|nr:hypothetical protein TNCV_947911 [Trichonephila clavipes]